MWKRYTEKPMWLCRHGFIESYDPMTKRQCYSQSDCDLDFLPWNPQPEQRRSVHELKFRYGCEGVGGTDIGRGVRHAWKTVNNFLKSYNARFQECLSALLRMIGPRYETVRNRTPSAHIFMIDFVIITLWITNLKIN